MTQQDDAPEDHLEDSGETALGIDGVDGLAALHDVEAESGDDEALADAFTLDRSEARELGVELDRVDGEEAVLD